MRLFFILLGLVIYPLAVHGLVMLDAPWIAIVGLVVTSLVSLLAPLLVRDAEREYRWSWIYALLAALGVLNIVTHSVYALFLPPVLVNLGLMLFFATTLRPGRMPIIERLMRLGTRNALGAELRAYARRLTWIWAAYFLVVAVLSLLLAWRAPLETWSLFTNVVNFIVMSVMFAVQYLYHQQRFRLAGQISLLRMLRRLGGLSRRDAAHPLYGGVRK